MRKFAKKLREKRNKGQTSVEYILLVAIVVLVIMKFKTTLTNNVEGISNEVLGKTRNGISQELDTVFQ